MIVKKHELFPTTGKKTNPMMIGFVFFWITAKIS